MEKQRTVRFVITLYNENDRSLGRPDKRGTGKEAIIVFI
jgi:hypothetical protein